MSAKCPSQSEDFISWKKQIDGWSSRLTERKRQRARNSLLAYCSEVYPQFESARHHCYVANELEQVERGTLTRFMVSEPPRHGKTLLASTLFPAWYLGRDPSRRVAVASYGDDRVSDIGRSVLRILKDDRHCSIFPESSVDENAASSSRVDLVAGGGFVAASRNSALTGRGCDLLIVDDLLKDSKEAASAAIRRECVEWFRSVALTRLSPGGAIVIGGTRWGRNDIFDFLLEEMQQEHWRVVNLPAIAGEGDQLGRAPGEALWPSRYGIEELAKKRFEVGPATWICLYQGDPQSAEGSILRREWWQFYQVLPEKFDRIAISADTAFKATASADYTCVQVWGKAPAGAYLLANWRSKVEFPQLKKMLLEFAGQWRPHDVLIEEKGSGMSLCQELQSSTSLPIRPIKVTTDKETRAIAITGQLEAGRVFLPANAPWLDAFLDECSSFPRGAHDDQVDACTMALEFLRDDGSILNGWASQGGSAFAAGDKATAEQREQLQKFALGGLPRTECPYFGAGAQPFRTKEEADLSLADAQKAALPGETRSQFNAARKQEPKAANKPKTCCPKCSNPNLAMCGEYKSCVCGWDSKQRVTA